MRRSHCLNSSLQCDLFATEAEQARRLDFEYGVHDAGRVELTRALDVNPMNSKFPLRASRDM